MKRRLITSALPYVNNIPHLGNLVQVLSADVFARFCRQRGYETLYVCGTDEYGTATETRAREEGITPAELCTRYFTIHDEIYRWFNISFDKFGRTSTHHHTEITQHIFLKLHENGYITEHTIEQLYSEKSDMFLADRYVRGTCPHCGYEDARGDQCENCGKLLDPTDLVNPRSILDDSTPVVRETSHLYINLPAIAPKLEAWLEESGANQRWAKNAVQMTQAWIRDGLKERSITRDLKWGIPVPLEEYKEKVFYVWFDAPIGYISITASLRDDWETWWRDPDNVELFQFVGKDNIPFHTVVFPSSLLGTGETWTLLKNMSSSEYLNYEGGMFSKSRGIGVFGTDAQETGIPADVWRFYIFYNRPETSDFTFTWDDFQEKVNGELIGNLANFVNRTLTFVSKYFDGQVPELGTDASAPESGGFDPGAFWSDVADREARITELLEKASIRDAFRELFALSSLGNRTFQAGEPWRTRKENPPAAAALLANLCFLLKDLAVLARPFMPETAERIGRFLGMTSYSWDNLGGPAGSSAAGGAASEAAAATATAHALGRIQSPEILFKTLEDEVIADLRERFSGSQAERAQRKAGADMTATPVEGGTQPAQPAEPTLEERFVSSVDIRTAKIVNVERHPKADKLYVETVDDGDNAERVIVSGLVPYYSEDELLGKTILLVSNLKPAKLRGIESQGMLLAADTKTDEGERLVEVLFVEGVDPGIRVVPESSGEAGAPGVAAADVPEISIDDFFAIPIRVENHSVLVGNAALTVGGNPIRTKRIADGNVG
ncbi:MAG: methionine--tRNA ligase [Spirochaetota bacterium]